MGRGCGEPGSSAGGLHCPCRSDEVTDPEPVLPACAGRGSGPVSEGDSHLSHWSQPWEAGGPPHLVLVTPGVCGPHSFWAVCRSHSLDVSVMAVRCQPCFLQLGSQRQGSCPFGLLQRQSSLRSRHVSSGVTCLPKRLLRGLSASVRPA